MIQKIIRDKIDIDKVLVVTFTNAAASEMRERILEAIYKKLEEEPQNMNLQRQIVLINKCNISTIHSFCLEVIKNNFYEIDISPNFRIGDTPEIELLKMEVIEDLFEEKYVSGDERFSKLINTYTNYRGDEKLKSIILEIYKFIQSCPFPEEALTKMVEQFNLKDKLENDFSKTIWGQIILNDIREQIIDGKDKLEYVLSKLKQEIELDKYASIIADDLQKLEALEKSTNSWDETYEIINSMKFETWRADKKTDCELKDYAKQIRDDVKKSINKVKEKTIAYTSIEANKDIYEMYEILDILKDLILEFSNRYSQKKKERNIIDFNDIEHKALQILLKKDEEGNYIPTSVANQYKEKFVEIAIDEYQDSNMVQEYILNSISKGNNIFMVGDVKQSIYRFRQAMPELFLEKYEHYASVDTAKNNENLKIKLFKNFRSRQNVLDITNKVFLNIMSNELGDIDYNEQEYLNLGAEYKELDKNENYAGIAELSIIDLKEEQAEEDDEVTEEPIENAVLEAKYVANKIKQVIESGYLVFDKKCGYRKVTYKDIVILLRATSVSAPIYEKALLEQGMPVFSDASQEYLDAVEIQTIMSLLKIIDNPNNDIPLVTVLRSSIGNFTDNDLIQIRLENQTGSFYNAMKSALQSDKCSKDIKQKITNIFNQLEMWRDEQEYLPLDELIWKIYEDTGYYNYVQLMPNGTLRTANLKMLFSRAKEYENASFKGLYNFINYIDRLKSSSGDLGAAKIIGENDDVIRIMSIHKSKGLEFPVVFLCGTGKQFNMQDLTNSILLHPKLGLGPEYINYERRIQYSTLAKEAIKRKMKIEAISEEMRVLYVALTRAREKLYITGVSKDLNKALKKQQEALDVLNNKNSKIQTSIVKLSKSYLDWLTLVYLYNKESIEEILKLNIIKKDDIMVKKEIKEDLNNVDIEKVAKENKIKEKQEEISKVLSWKYEYDNLTKIQSKTSVTKIKQLSESVPEESIQIDMVPKFLSGTETVSNARKGTLMHLCLQKLDLRQEYTKEQIQEVINGMVANRIIMQNEADCIDTEKILEFTKSDLAKRIRKAKNIYKEAPFYINIPVNKIYKEENSDEKVLVQGIIDLYFIDELGKVVLVDYKTDRVKVKEELVEKYNVQLEIYKKALEKALGKTVDEVYIYSLYLNEEIALKPKLC